jgi:acyl-CoA thioester hydrolase
LTIESTPRTIGGATLELDQRVLRGQEVLIPAQVRIACVAQGRPARIPKGVREALGG